MPTYSDVSMFPTMPINLYHGHPDPTKNIRFQELILNANNQIIVPEQNSLTKVKEDILSISENKILFGDSVITWQDFLISLLKFNGKRVRLANSTLCKYLIFTLTRKKLKSVKEIHQFFTQVKSCGMNLEDIKSHFSQKLESDDLFSLFENYQNELKKKDFYDQGDLCLEVLSLLKTNKLKIHDSHQSLFFTNFYPMTPGQREILRLLRDHYSDLKIHIFYDGDFRDDHPLLERCYEDLGNLADHTEHFSSDKNITPLRFTNPYHEVSETVAFIKNDLNSGRQPSDFAFVLLDESYSQNLLRALHKENIPVSNQFPLNCKNLTPVSKNLSVNAEDDLYTNLKLKAVSTSEEFIKNITFIDSILETAKDVPDNEKKSFLKDWQDELKFSPNPFPEQVIVTTVHGSANLLNRTIFVLGSSLENIVTNENSLYSPILNTSTELAELVNSPSFQMRVNLEKLRHLALSDNTVYLTSSDYDLQNKPTTPIIFNEDCVSIKYSPLIRESKTIKLDYFKTKKKTFSLSELQEYINCPYRYYAKFHLKLGSKESEDLELGADVKGLFVHKVLQRLIEENEAEYLEGLEYESYRKKIFKALGGIIQSELESYKSNEAHSEILNEYFAYRVYKSVMCLVNEEARLFNEGLKRTKPRHYEWGFQFSHEDITIKGRIDRIDINLERNNYTVIDYKTGTLPSTTQVLRGNVIQLPIYLMASHDLFPDCTPAGGLYYSLGNSETKGFVISNRSDEGVLNKRSQITDAAWEETKTNTLAKIREGVDNIHKGVFKPKPITANECMYCDYKNICGFKYESN